MTKYVSACAILLSFSLMAWAAPRKSNNQATLKKEAKITMKQAKKTALAKEPGKVQSKELERENGKVIYSFDIKNKSGIHEVNVDAMNGQVVSDKTETAAQERQEKAMHSKTKSKSNTGNPGQSYKH